MRPLKIIQIVSSIEAEAAGPAYSVPRMARALTEVGHDCQLMSLGTPGHCETMGVSHTRFTRQVVGLGPLCKLGVSSDMKRALADLVGVADIFHTNGLWMMPNCYPSSVALPGRTEVVLSPRGMLSGSALQYSASAKRVFWTLWQQRALRRVGLFHATSEMEFEDIRRAGWQQPVAIVPNGIDLPELEDIPVRRPSDQRTILFLGRLHPIKRLETLIEAWSGLEAAFPNWRLVIRGPGDPDYAAKLRDHAASFDMSRCEFGDALYGAEKLRAFQEASLHVLPSASENFAMTVAESLACSTPVIASRGTPWRGLPENRCGWWVEHGAGPLAVALREAMSLPPAELDRMGANGRAWVLRDFSWDAIGRDMGRAYQWLKLDGDPPPFVHF